MRRPIAYVLNEQGTPIPVGIGNRHDAVTWARSMEKDRIVKQSRGHGLLISTIFLGVDYAFHGPPQCWETLVCKEGGWEDIELKRCTGGREQAEAMHQEMCKRFDVPVD